MVLLVLSAGADAADAAVTLSTSGTTIVLASGSGNNQTYTGVTAGGEAFVHNDAGMTLDPGANADCQMDATYPTQRVDCSGPYDSIAGQYGGGNDTFSVGLCVAATALDMGDGNNTFNGDGCQGLAMTTDVTGGNGQDTFRGGDALAPPALLVADTFTGGGGDDNLHGGDGNDVLHGGEGNDSLYGGQGNDQVFGDGGADEPDGGPGDDRVDGGPGNDALERSQGAAGNDRGEGADTYVGGEGSDKLILDSHVGGMNISIDGAANDGTPGEHDNVGGDIESITGTAGNDVFTGSAGPDSFDGNSGNDEIHGAGGNDDLDGGGGDDKIYGDAGSDKLQGSNGADIVDGGAGTDQIYGDRGACSVFCSSDADMLFARDGERDAVDCGGGADSAQVDYLDVVAFCASVDRSGNPPPPPSPPPPSPPPPTSPRLGFTVKGKAVRSKGVVVDVFCGTRCTFTVTLVLGEKYARKYGLGRKTLTIGTARGLIARSRPEDHHRQAVGKGQAQAAPRGRDSRNAQARAQGGRQDHDHEEVADTRQVARRFGRVESASRVRHGHHGGGSDAQRSADAAGAVEQDGPTASPRCRTRRRR